jgi:hypothetical protein
MDANIDFDMTWDVERCVFLRLSFRITRAVP